MSRHHVPTNEDNVIDSRDIIKRLEELEAEGDYDPDSNDNNNRLSEEDLAELRILRNVAKQGEHSPDWHHGETMIRDDYFEEYIQEQIDECYPDMKKLGSGDWPFRHVHLDLTAAADEAKQDYFDIDFDGVAYWIRA